ncbi:MAG: acyltransferase [Flavihumibacter sp.]
MIDEPVQLADGVRIWHFCHLMPGVQIGAGTQLGQNVFVGRGVRIGAGCKVQNNVSVYEGVELADKVFVGPSVVFTNVRRPRAFIEQKGSFLRTYIAEGVTIGANATIVCGIHIGAYAFIAAGAVVTRDVPAYAKLMGVPGRVVGRVDEAGNDMA